ncbi:sensor domain-containing protein [Mycolicibacterium parafortuitum]|uniref:sensor domain-containing protein n=1 Tax=Mycolicibacterium parafortuitum TaxID=39692 RepID=UPI0009F50707|nr:sensor domain-containing protein [Mycolicibacterium parafortuitum]
MSRRVTRGIAGGAVGAVCAGAVLSGCAGAPVDQRPVVRIVEVAQPSPAIPLGGLLPTAPELAGALGTGPNALMGTAVEGDADILLSSVTDANIAPVECVGAAYRLQDVVYRNSPVRSVASNTWAGGGLDGPPVAGFFGVVQMTDQSAAQAFFGAATELWRRCNGQSVAVQQPGAGADELSRITDVVFDDRMVSASVLHTSGGAAAPTALRALGVAGDCVVEVEITDPRPAGDPRGAVAVADVILDKITASR